CSKTIKIINIMNDMAKSMRQAPTDAMGITSLEK
ncbi:unnamed protein product, partial [marine sediment metagenome]